MYEFTEGNGLCTNCKRNSVVNMSGVELCLTHFAQEMSLTNEEARTMLQNAGININVPLSITWPPEGWNSAKEDYSPYFD